MKYWTNTYLFLTGKIEEKQRDYWSASWSDGSSYWLFSVLATQFQKYPAQYILAKE